MTDWDRLSTRAVDVVSDAFMCVRRAALESINGYDEGMLLYYTEDDVSLRLSRLGWGVYHCAGAKARHYGQVTSRKRSPWLIAWLHRRDAVHYFRKYHGRLAACIVNAFWTADMLVRVPSKYAIEKIGEWRSQTIDPT